MEQLTEKKNDLLQKLGTLTAKPADNNAPSLPKNLKILTGFGVNAQRKCIEFVVQSNVEQTYIKQVILYADSLFSPYECYVHTVEKPEEMVRVPLTMISDNVK